MPLQRIANLINPSVTRLVRLAFLRCNEFVKGCLIRNYRSLGLAIAVGIPPILLLGFAIIRSEHEVVLGMSSFMFALLVVGGGVVVYLINHALKPMGWAPNRETVRPAA